MVTLTEKKGIHIKKLDDIDGRDIVKWIDQVSLDRVIYIDNHGI